MKTKFALSFLAVLGGTLPVAPVMAAHVCRSAHVESGLSSEQISSRIDALIAEQIRVQQYNFSDPALFNQSRAYVETEKSRLAQVVPDFENIYRNRYLVLRDQLKQKFKAQRQQDKAEEQKRQEAIQEIESIHVQHKQSVTTTLHYNFETAGFTSDRQHVFTPSKDGIQLIEIKSGIALPRITSPLNAETVIHSVLSHDGKLILASAFRGLTMIIDAQSHQLLKETYFYGPAALGSFGSNRNPSILVYNDIPKKVIKIQSGSDLYRIPAPDKLLSAVLSPDGNLLFLSFGNSKGLLVNPISGDTLREIPDVQAVLDARFTSNEIQVVTQLPNGKSHILDETSGQTVGLADQYGQIEMARLSPNGRYLVATTSHRSVVLFDATTGEVLHVEPKVLGVIGLSFGSDSKQFFIASKLNYDLTIHTYDMFGKLFK